MYDKVISLYMKANAKLVPPAIMGEDVAVQKFVRRWEDIDTIVRRQKGSNKVEERITPELDRLFDLMYCQCTIMCVQVITDKHDKCSHSKLRCCDKEITCILDNCSHKQVVKCVEIVNCSQASCKHKKTLSFSCICTKEKKLPSLDLSFIRAQRLKLGEKSAYQMGKVDKKETMKQVGTLQRKEADRIMDENRNRKMKKLKKMSSREKVRHLHF